MADLWAYGVLAAVLIVSAVTDASRGKIYNMVTYPAIAAGLIGHALVGGVHGRSDAQMTSPGLVGALLGFAMGFCPLLLAWLAGGINGGDAKLMGAVGALGGWELALGAMFYGFAVAAIMAIVVMVRRRIVRRTLARIFRFLYLVFTPTRPASPATEDSPKIPFGLALCLGSAMAIIELRFFDGRAASVLGL